MWNRGRMPSTPSTPRPPWWHRRLPSTVVFLVVLGVMSLAAVALWADVGEVLPDVAKDNQGEDPWTDPVGVEKVAGFEVVRIPDCAAAPVVRIALWNEASEPYWEVSGPATPMDSVAIGATPEGFTEVKAFTKPPEGAVLRLEATEALPDLPYNQAVYVRTRIMALLEYLNQLQGK